MLAALSLPLAFSMPSWSGCQKAEPKLAAPKPAEVLVSYPVEDTVTEFEEFTGRTMAVATVEIRARVSGYLDRVFFQDGAIVKAGDKLFEIDPRSYRAELERAQATVAQNRARLERLNHQEGRRKKLVANRVVTEEELELATADRAEGDAILAASIASEELAQLNLSFTLITSPINGRIGRRLVDPGNLVRADESALTTIVSIDPIYGYFDVDERTVLRLRRLIQQGKIQAASESDVKVELALADQDEYSLTGIINFMDNQIEASTGTLRVRAVIENKQGLLSPGLFLRLRVPIGAPHRALLVREEALGTDQGQRFVYVVDNKDEVVYRRVKVGPLVAGRRVIETGLNASDRVVVTGLQRVRPGVKVAPKPADASLNLAIVPPEPGATPSGGK
jgi:RND family efflux transporter MFP subunit